MQALALVKMFCFRLVAPLPGGLDNRLELQQVSAHPKDWVELLVACVLMQPVLSYGAAWFRRRKLAELNEVKGILYEMDEKSVS